MMEETEKLERLAKKFIIGYKPLTKDQIKLIGFRDEIDRELQILEIKQERLIKIQKAIMKKLYFT